MKLVRYGPQGREKPGIVDAKGRIRDLSKIVPDIAGDALSPKGLNKIRKAPIDKLPLVKGGVRIGACVGNVRQFHRHRPELFRSCRRVRHAGPEGADHLQQGAVVYLRSERRHHDSQGRQEARLGGGTRHRDRQRARYLTKDKALDVVAGYCLANDVSEREFQIERRGQWIKGKSAETFGPLGPWLVTKDEIKDPQSLDMWLDVNGQRRQRGNTKTMIFDAATSSGAARNTSCWSRAT